MSNKDHLPRLACAGGLSKVRINHIEQAECSIRDIFNVLIDKHIDNKISKALFFVYRNKNFSENHDITSVEFVTSPDGKYERIIKLLTGKEYFRKLIDLGLSYSIQADKDDYEYLKKIAYPENWLRKKGYEYFSKNDILYMGQHLRGGNFELVNTSTGSNELIVEHFIDGMKYGNSVDVCHHTDITPSQ